MSDVIVLSDSDESVLSADIQDRNKYIVDINEKHNFNLTSDFDLPKVSFCHEIAQNTISQSKNNLVLNPNNFKSAHYESYDILNSYDSESNYIKETLQKKTTKTKKNKITLNEERLKRQQALAKEKTLKTLTTKSLKNIKPGECLKFMEVNIHRGIEAFAFLPQIKSVLLNANIKFNITTELISNSITWQRNIDNYVSENNEVCVRKNIQIEQYAIVIWNSQEAVKHVAEGTFCSSILNNKTLMPNYNITLIIFGIEKYFEYRKKTKLKEKEIKGQPGYSSENKQSKYKGNQQFKTFPVISRQQFEMCLTEVQLVAKCSSKLIENAQDLALMIYQYTKSISEIPYKLQKKESLENKFDWYVIGDNRNTVRVDKSGNGLRRLWQQQLCQFNLSSLEIAEAICTVYPSPMQLIKTYRNCTPDEGINLLRDIPIRRAAGPLTAVRKVGPELSKKIYVMFTSQNGDTLLGIAE